MQENDINEEEGIDPSKLFDEKQYNTLIINREGFSKKENTSADLIEGLLEKGITRQELERIYSDLKKADAGAMLVDAIAHASASSEKKKLIAACWESGLDFSGHFLFFAELVLSGDFETALEALTVIEEMENVPAKEDVINVLDRIAQAPVPNANVAELKNYLSTLDRLE